MHATLLQQLAHETAVTWPAIDVARAKTAELLTRLRDGLREYDDPNYSIVVTGSLGRGEASETSDADWFLLVDGLSNL
jgi:UTP:GlnB (protein PII) uridylyltransferase